MTAARVKAKANPYAELVSRISGLADQLEVAADQIGAYGSERTELAESVRESHEKDHAGPFRWCVNDPCRMAHDILAHPHD
jgi:hypothetical protein